MINLRAGLLLEYFLLEVLIAVEDRVHEDKCGAKEDKVEYNPGGGDESNEYFLVFEFTTSEIQGL